LKLIIQLIECDSSYRDKQIRIIGYCLAVIKSDLPIDIIGRTLLTVFFCLLHALFQSSVNNAECVACRELHDRAQGRLQP
jgi:hypothetical protein